MSSDRGWNDPPSFAFSNSSLTGPRKVLLRKAAVNDPQTGSSKGETPLPPAKPPTGPPIHTLPKPSGGESRVGPDGEKTQTVEVDVNQALHSLDNAWDHCRERIPKKASGDVERRLKILRHEWESGRLSSPVQHQMVKLLNALELGDYDEAHGIHVNLMVNHVTEVSQWMVAVKRMISVLQQEIKTSQPSSKENLDIDSQTKDVTLDKTA
eukprot:m.127919 g.127919  ORF g.127919 m.127919 type:complete len:210 (+) comp37939_c0_seq2:230-859(+)